MVQVADFNHEDFDPRNQTSQDDGLLVRFFSKPIADQLATQEKGRPMFKDVDWIDIKVPGSRDGVCRPARPRDISRFPRHYQAYKNRTSDEEVLEGTPLSEWPGITRARVEELAFANIRTVENLAAAPDSNLQQFMGMNVLKAKAIAWLQAAKEARPTEELHEELAKRDEEIAELQAAVKAMQKTQPKVTKKKAAKKKPKVTMLKE